VSHSSRRRSFRRILAGFGLAAVAAYGPRSGGFVRAQEPPPEAALEIPAVEAELVRVDVVVTDRAGRPVTDLVAEDFLLLEDGRPQPLTHFQAPSAGGPAAAAAPEARATAPAAGRRVVLAVDDLHLSPGSLERAKAALKRFISEQASDEDELALVTTSASVGMLQSFTRERAVLRRAVDRLAYRERRANAGGRATMSEYEAQAIDRGDPEALRLATQEITLRELISPPARAGGVQNPHSEIEARGMARSLLAQALDATNRTLGTLELVVRNLGAVPGRKALVLVSDGFVIGQGTQDPRAFDLRRIFDASTRAGVAVYALDCRGVAAGSSVGDASQPALLDQANPAPREGYTHQAALATRDSLAVLAEGTGGFLVHGTNDLDEALGRILHDGDAAYLLAYTPSREARDGRFRSIEVRLPGRSGLTVRAREGYYAAGAPARGAAGARDARREDELRGALASLVPLSGIPLRMAADFVDLPPRGPQLVVRAHIDLGGVRFVRDGELYLADVEVVTVVYDQAGEPVGEVEARGAELALRTAEHRLARAEGLRYQRSVPVKPGLYQVRLAARESRLGQLGSAFQWVEVPDTSAGALLLSSVFLFAAPLEAAAAVVAPVAGPGARLETLRDVQALRRFARDASLYYCVYAYNPVRDASGATEVVFQAQVWDGDRLQGASSPQAVAFGAGVPSVPVSGRIDLTGLGPGDYELRVLLLDRKANASALRRVGFTIEGAASG
jgi:VWFA-related protein